MVSKVAAIAMLAMVVLPIGLGYALSFDEVERDGWRSTEKINISDQLLNSEYPYYVNSNSPNNNGAVLLNSQLIAPMYNSVTNVPSSLPEYTVNDVTINAGSRVLRASPITDILAFDGDVISDFSGSVTYVSGYPLYWISAEAPINIVDDRVTESTGEYSLYVLPIGDDVKFLSSAGGSVYTSSGSCHIYCEGGISATWNIYSYSATALSGSNYVISAVGATPGNWPASSLVLQTGDGVQYAGRADGAVYRSGIVTTIDGDVFTGVTGVSIANSGAYRQSLDVATGQYVQPSEGWQWPIMGNEIGGPIALAGEIIDTVTMYLSLPTSTAYQSLEILPELNADGTGDRLNVIRSGGMIAVGYGDETVDLGRYSMVQIVISADAITVSGIVAWPSMYSSASTLNSVSFERVAPGQYAGIMDRGHTVGVSLRIDSVQVLGGYFPTTKDYSLNVGESFPDRSVSIDFPSVGIYGSSIAVASGSATVTYTIADGKLSDLDNTPMLDAVFSSTVMDGEYSISLNGKEILTGTEPMIITFDGDWSMAVNLYLLESFTSSSLEWVPGVYAFDQTDSTVVGIFACVGAFIALAMVRPFSGAKMIMLAIVCGCGAIIFLIML